MPAFDRIDRISEEVRREIDTILREDISDPRVCGTWSITRCEVTRDLRYCKVRISILEEDLRGDMMKALRSAAGFVRREIGARLALRYTPQFTFVAAPWATGWICAMCPKSPSNWTPILNTPPKSTAS